MLEIKNTVRKKIIRSTLFGFAGIVFTSLLLSCSTVPESQALHEIRVGMTKSEVLNIAGSPKISDRRLNQDRWVYETDDGPSHKFVRTYVFFAHNRVTYIGEPNKIHAKSSRGDFQPVGE